MCISQDGETDLSIWTRGWGLTEKKMKTRNKGTITDRKKCFKCAL